jgi:hypothetical protein
MKASEVMRRAAEIAEAWKVGGCHGIVEAFGSTKQLLAKRRAQRKFEELFENTSFFWFGPPWDCEERPDPELRNGAKNQAHRIIAMLLTADILKSEGD